MLEQAMPEPDPFQNPGGLYLQRPWDDASAEGPEALLAEHPWLLAGHQAMLEQAIPELDPFQNPGGLYLQRPWDDASAEGACEGGCLHVRVFLFVPCVSVCVSVSCISCMRFRARFVCVCL
mmetsp:Transcript_81246/g.218519  ORF Transcript_81246/g.218519 Transcript_81246/m.218519 type:complete len:121 (-) Transcript_81246:148-510(-)